MAKAKEKKPKLKSFFERRDDTLNDIYAYQHGNNPNKVAEDSFPNLNKKKPKKKGWFN